MNRGTHELDRMLEIELHQLVLKYQETRISKPRAHARLMASLAEHGQVSPVSVVPLERDRYSLIDGYRRVGALRSLKEDTVQVVVLPLTEPEALVWHQKQADGRRCSPVEEAWLLQTLMQSHGMSQEELARKLWKSKSWISHRLSLIRVLPERVQELVRQGGICAHAAARYLVALARANTESCVSLAENAAKHKLSSRQLERLYNAWRAGDDEVKRRIEERPDLFARANEAQNAQRSRRVKRRRQDRQAKADTTICEPMSYTQELAAELDEVTTTCTRLCKELENRPCDQPLPAAIGQAWSRARHAFDTLTEILEEHAGQ